MIKVYTSSVIDAPADTVWAQVRDFNGLPKWTLRRRIAHRERHARGQDRLRAQLPPSRRRRDPRAAPHALDYDYQCSYSILESPMGVENYVATLKLTPVTDGNRTFAEWWAEFDCAPARATSRRTSAGRFSGRI